MKRVLGGIAAVAVVAAATIAAGQVSAQVTDDVILLHGVPGVPVDVSVDGSVVFADFQPQQAENLNSFRGQTLADVQLFEAGTQTALTDPTSLPVPDAGSWTIVAHLDAASAVVISPFENNTAPTAADGNGRLTVRHNAATDAVDLVVGADRPITGLAPGGQSELELAVGTISDAQLAPAGEAPVVTLPPLDITAGNNLIVYVVGPNTGGAFEFYTQTVALAAPATTTTDPDATTTTTDPDATTTTTTTDPDASTTTTVAETTTTAVAVPTAVNTGSPLDSPISVTLILVALGGVLVAGTALITRRRVNP